MRKIKILVLATIAIIILGIMNTANAAIAIKEDGRKYASSGEHFQNIMICHYK